jgi:uncharacterized protein (TIGR00251 family)
MSWLSWQGELLRLALRVQPGARDDAFGTPLGDELRVRIKAPAVDGKANARLVAFLARACGVPKHRVRLARGALGRSKVVFIDAPVVLPAPLAESRNDSRESS